MFQVDRQSQYIQGYRLMYRPSGGLWLQQDVKAAPERRAVINGLLKGTEYEMKIRPYFNEFQGLDSRPLTLRTLEEGKGFRLDSPFIFTLIHNIQNISSSVVFFIFNV